MKADLWACCLQVQKTWRANISYNIQEQPPGSILWRCHKLQFSFAFGLSGGGGVLNVAIYFQNIARFVLLVFFQLEGDVLFHPYDAMHTRLQTCINNLERQSIYMMSKYCWHDLFWNLYIYKFVYIIVYWNPAKWPSIDCLMQSTAIWPIIFILSKLRQFFSLLRFYFFYCISKNIFLP